jgi:hypothetical protein
MITAERQDTSRLIALDEESRVLGYNQSIDPKRFLRELGGGKRPHQVRIYEVCPSTVDDAAHYYDFEAACLLRREPNQDEPD